MELLPVFFRKEKKFLLSTMTPYDYRGGRERRRRARVLICAFDGVLADNQFFFFF